MNVWTTVRLAEVTSKIGSGATPRGGKNAYKRNGISLIRSMNIFDAKFDYKNLAFIDEQQARKLNNVSVEKDDVLINITGASVCRCTSVPENVLPARVNQHVSIIRADRKKLHPYFLKYYLIHPEIKKYLYAQASTGATREALTKNDLETLEVSIPNYKYQVRITDIISAYDNIIENNQKRIRILEEMAQRLYTEWFVKFQFPGHEKVKMADSGTEFGMIPDGWEVKRLSEFASLTMGQSPKSEFYNENGEGLPFHQGVSNFGYLYPENKVYSSKGNRIAKKGELLFSVRAPVGKLNIATSEMILGRGLASIRHKQNRQSFLLSMFFNKFTENDMLGNGSIYKSINKSELENLLFVVPSEELMEIFEPISEKYFEKLNILTKSVTNLSRTRDLLIENLVTGKRILKS
jgi:type I restriction enzyme, S subunit